MRKVHIEQQKILKLFFGGPRRSRLEFNEYLNMIHGLEFYHSDYSFDNIWYEYYKVTDEKKASMFILKYCS